MSDYKEKPKRQPFQERPFLYLAVGILIGIFVAAIAFVAFFMIAGSETQISSVDAPIYALPTQVPPPISGQGIVQPQPTVVANRIQSVNISPDGNRIAVISVDGNVSSIFLNSLEQDSASQVALFRGPGYYSGAIFSPDGRYLTVRTEELNIVPTIMLIDVQTREPIGQIQEADVAVFSSDSERLVMVGTSTGIRVMDTATLHLIESHEFTANIVQAVAYSSRNQIAIAADSQVQVYNVNNLNAPPAIIVNDRGFIYDVAFHPNGEHLAIGGEGFVQIVNIPAEARTQYNFDTRQIFSLAFSDNGEWLAIGGGDSGIGEARLTVFRWSISDVIQPDPNYYDPITLTGHNHVVTDVAFTPDGNLLSASWDGTIRLWDLETQSEISQMGY